MYFYAENVHGIRILKIGYNFNSITKLSIITEYFWNLYMKLYEIALGENLIFECHYAIFDDIFWEYGAAKITDTNKYIFSNVRSRHMNIQRMEIKNVTRADDGWYGCGEHTSLRVGVIIKVPPKIYSDLSNNSITKNSYEPVDLKCNVEENSITSFLWYKDGQPLNNASNTKFRQPFYEIKWKIENFAHDDAGKYSCVVTNHFGSDERFVLITYESKLNLN